MIHINRNVSVGDTPVKKYRVFTVCFTVCGNFIITEKYDNTHITVPTFIYVLQKYTK